MLSVLEGYHQPRFTSLLLDIWELACRETGEPSIDVMPAHGGVGADVVAVLLDLILWDTGPVLSETVVAQRSQAHDLKQRPGSKWFP